MAAQMQQHLEAMAQPTQHNDPGADNNPRVVRWVRTQDRIYVDSKRAARSERGLICYQACKPEEIVRFAQARRADLVPTPRAPISYLALIDCLEKADARLTIRFGDLKEVIRKVVYEFHHAELDKEGIRTLHKQPAITWVNRLLRREALPLFYKLCTFHLHFESLRAYNDATKWPRGPVTITVNSGKLLKSVNPVWLRAITRFDLNVLVQRKDTIHLDMLVSLRFNMKAGRISYEIIDRTEDPHGELVLLSPSKEDMDTVLRTMVAPNARGVYTWVGWKRNHFVTMSKLFERLAVDAGAI